MGLGVVGLVDLTARAGLDKTFNILGEARPVEDPGDGMEGTMDARMGTVGGVVELL